MFFDDEAVEEVAGEATEETTTETPVEGAEAPEATEESAE